MVDLLQLVKPVITDVLVIHCCINMLTQIQWCNSTCAMLVTFVGQELGPGAVQVACLLHNVWGLSPRHGLEFMGLFGSLCIHTCLGAWAALASGSAGPTDGQDYTWPLPEPHFLENLAMFQPLIPCLGLKQPGPDC